MKLVARIIHRRRLEAARIWQNAAREQAARHNDAVRRILDEAEARRDPT
jgi:hypothetical protein